MRFRFFLIPAGLAATLAIAGCGEEEVSDIQYAQVKDVLQGDAAQVRSALKPYKGKKVRWTGHVAEAVRQFGDDYVEEGILLVDMDGAEAEPKAADVVFNISPSDIDSFQPGQPVTFEGVIRETERKGNDLLLKLELKKME